MKKNIIILGPGKSMPGGMLEVINQIMNADMPSISQKRIHIPTASKTKKHLVFLIAILRIVVLCSIGKVEFVHINMSERGSINRTEFLLKLFLFFKVKTIVHSHGSELIDDYNSMNENEKSKFKYYMCKATMIIALTNGWKQFWATIVPEKNIRVLPNGVTIQKEEPKEYIKEDCLQVLFLGYIGERKGTYDLLRAIKLIDGDGIKIKLSIAGNGEIEKCNKFVRDNNLSNVVDVYGWIEGEKKERLLEKCDLLVLPSHFESFGIVALEAMARKLPVICGDKGFTKEIIIEGKTGLVAHTGDEVDISRKIRFLNDKNLLEEFGKNGYELVKAEYSIEMVMKKLEMLYGELLNEKRIG